jgi:hypothetical protein
MLALDVAQFSIAEWLLEHGGSSITERYRAPHGKSASEVLMDNFPIGDRGYAATLISLSGHGAA